MPNPNAIVSSTIRLEPPLDRAPEEILRAEASISVELEGERRVRLDPADSRSAGFAKVLDGLSKQGLPVYVEIDPATQAVTQLLIPHVARVVSISPSEGTLDIELEPSHARHHLRLGEADSAEMERELRDALQSGRLLIVTEDDAHHIIDIRPFTPPPKGPPHPFPPFPRPRPGLPPRYPCRCAGSGWSCTKSGGGSVGHGGGSTVCRRRRVSRSSTRWLVPPATP